MIGLFEIKIASVCDRDELVAEIFDKSSMSQVLEITSVGGFMMVSIFHFKQLEVWDFPLSAFQNAISEGIGRLLRLGYEYSPHSSNAGSQSNPFTLLPSALAENRDITVEVHCTLEPETLFAIISRVNREIRISIFPRKNLVPWDFNLQFFEGILWQAIETLKTLDG